MGTGFDAGPSSGALRRSLPALGLALTEQQLDHLDELRRLVQDWNTRLNLTAIRDTEGVELKHFADSLAPAAHGWRALPGGKPRTLIDVGSGAGFPALPLAIAFPDVRVTALEPSRKKSEFIQLAALQLGLDVRVLRSRGETQGRLALSREKYDCVVARAVSYLPTLAELCLPLARVGGAFVAMKSERLEEEIADGVYAVEHLGGRLLAPIPYEIPGLGGTRWLLVAEKVAATPREYPREKNLPKKRPLVGQALRSRPQRRSRE